MPKYLLEYKGIPTIVELNLTSIEKTTFVVAYKTKDGDFKRIDFDNLEKAIEYENDNAEFIHRFLWIKSENKRVTYRTVSLVKGKIVVTAEIRTDTGDCFYTTRYGMDSFTIAKRSVKKGGLYSITYIRRKKVQTKDGYVNQLLDSYYELVPEFNDIFLEAIFFHDVITRNPDVSTKNEIEAYFLQATIRHEDKEAHKSGRTQKDDGSQTDETGDKSIDLNNLIGLDEVKLELEELQALSKLRKTRMEYGLPLTPSTLHLVFQGNPGTGKTTVARLLGQIYYDIGLLPTNKVVEVSRGDLVGEYIGHTAPKTQKVFESAIGGILFIDEAYSLFKEGRDFGNEAVETLLKLMEDNREKVVVIIAGYPKEMDDFLASNPGFISRFSKTLHFRDYNKEELIAIFEKMAIDVKNNLSQGAKFKLELLVDKYYDEGMFASNARSIRNLFEETFKRQSKRLMKIEKPTQEDMTTFIETDIPDTIK